MSSNDQASLPSNVQRFVALLRCPQCMERLQMSAEGLDCSSCGQHSSSLPDVDLVAAAEPERTLGAAFIDSRLAARIYQSLWRPLTFGLSSGFRKPSFAREAELVLTQLARHSGPWLDLACGPGALAERMLARHPEELVVASDLSSAMLQRAAARSRAFRVRADALNLPFADGAFGAVVNLAALDLYTDPERALRECLRVLKPGGAWLGSCFVWPERWLRWSRTPLLAPLFSESGSHGLTAAALCNLLRRVGFTAIEERAFGGYLLVWAEKPPISTG
ncbi:MAG TPA: class I SAM-dependent methyltransferase [Polyangiaceae bacterium]|nr:class I SAM-dependent methyltransferase [Polyangiaceae bacterium]